MKLSFDAGAALVTGGSGGIGSAIVRALGASGVPVGFTYSGGKERAEALLRGATADKSLAAFPWSGSSFAQAAELLHAVRSALGPVRFVVAAAGIAQRSALHRLGEDEARKLIDVNLTGALAVVRAAAPALMKDGTGRIVLVGSVSGRRGIAGHTVYAATKAALEGFARALAREAGPFGVTVNTVAPGFIDTQMLDGIPEGARAAWRERIPLARLGRAEEVAAAVSFLLSNEAAYVTGQTIVVDGGISL